MQFLWKKIVSLAISTAKLPLRTPPVGLPTRPCFSREKIHSRVFAALVRVISVVRSIVAMEEGAVGRIKIVVMKARS
jgi:hypothetical protein